MRIAILSTYRINCGIARFAETLETSLESHCDVEVIPLERSILKKGFGGSESSYRTFLKHLRLRLDEFDAVNIQFEYSLLSDSTRTSIARLMEISSIHKNTTITFHTLLIKQRNNSPSPLHYLKNFQPFSAVTTLIKKAIKFDGPREESKLLQRLASKKIKIIVHTNSSKNQLEFITKSAATIFCHPLCYTDKADRVALGSHAENRTALETKYQIKSDLIVGVFGFFGNYKGFDVALKALRSLKLKGKAPVLVVCGGLHPEDVRNNATSELASWNKYIQKHELYDNIVYTGSVPDLDMYKLISAVDVCWLPYREVGQEASAIVSEVAEIAKSSVISRNIPFSEYAKFGIRNDFVFFEIDNYVELAQKTENLTNSSAAQMKESRMYPNSNFKSGQAHFYLATLSSRSKADA